MLRLFQFESDMVPFGTLASQSDDDSVNHQHSHCLLLSEQIQRRRTIISRRDAPSCLPADERRNGLSVPCPFCYYLHPSRILWLRDEDSSHFVPLTSTREPSFFIVSCLRYSTSTVSHQPRCIRFDNMVETNPTEIDHTLCFVVLARCSPDCHAPFICHS